MRLGAWARWLLFAEGLVLLLAMAGPGRRRRAGQRESNHDLIARQFIDDPNWLEATAANFVAVNLFFALAFFAAWGVGKWRRSRQA